MDPETSELREKLDWIGLSIRAGWNRVAKWNGMAHQYLHTKHPKATKWIGSFLRFFFDMSTHPAFAVVVAFLLVGLVISEAITMIVSLSAVFAWIITILWVAHSEIIKKLSILPKIVIVVSFGFGSAYVANKYTQWCLNKYTLKHSSEHSKTIDASTEQKLVKPDTNQLLLEAFQKALSRSVPAYHSQSSYRPANVPQPEIPKIVFGFYEADFKAPVQTLQFDSLINNTATFDLSFDNFGTVPAQNLLVWARICHGCEWVSVPPGFVEVDRDHPFDRELTLPSPWLPNVASSKQTFVVRIPLHNPRYTGTELSLYYACSNCANVDWAKPQKLLMSRTLGVMTKQLFPSISYIQEPGH